MLFSHRVAHRHHILTTFPQVREPIKTEIVFFFLVMIASSVKKNKKNCVFFLFFLAHSGSSVNQLLRRAAAAALRRERNSSTHSDDMGMKRHRMDSGPISSPLDALNLPQVTAADFSTSVKHSNNNLSPHPKDRDDRHDGGKMAIGKLSHFCLVCCFVGLPHVHVLANCGPT